MSVYVSPVQRSISQAIREMLKNAKVSQTEAARRTGIPLTTLNRRLNNHGPAFFYHEMAALREVVGCSPVEMVTRAEQIAAGWADN